MNKKKTSIFLKLLYLFFIVYCILSIVEKTGYYERRVSAKTNLTEKQRLKFEEDVKNGKVINVNDYFEKEKDYSNAVTKSANFVTNKLGTLLNTKCNNVFDFIKSLFIG